MMKRSLVILFLGFSMGKGVSAQSIKLITYNIRLQLESDGPNNWVYRKDFLAGQVKFHDPDIFGVQEALPSQVEDLAHAFQEYSMVGTGRDGYGKGESSNIFFRRSRFILKDSGTFWLSETPDRVSKGWDAALNRVCTYVLIRDKQSTRTFWVFNTHLDHVGELARQRSIELILSEIKRKNTRQYPVVLMGDLNSTPDLPYMQSLKGKMNDAKDLSEVPAFGPEGTFNGFKYNEPVSRRIDYIFVSPGIRVRRYGVLTDSRDLRFPSDHFPVCAELVL